MNFDMRESKKPGFASLIKGIITDARNLFIKELTAARIEIREELETTKHAAVMLGLGLVIILIGASLLAVMATYILQATTGMQLWACYGIVGAAVTLVGAVFLLMGRKRATRVDFRPTESVEGSKEDLRWLKHKVISGKR